jgi:hypothetical protein
MNPVSKSHFRAHKGGPGGETGSGNFKKDSMKMELSEDEDDDIFG